MRELRRPKSNTSDNLQSAGAQAEPKLKKDTEDSELLMLKVQLEKLRKENASLKKDSEVKAPLAIRNNVEKIIKAIEVESKVQETDKPIIGSTKIRKVYKINKDHFSQTLLYAKENGIFDRNKISYSGKVETFEWWLIKKQ